MNFCFFSVLLLFAVTLPASLAKAVALPSSSLIVVHASRHYHTTRSTALETDRIITQAARSERSVFALVQNDISEDPDWYTFRDFPLITQALHSRMGQHELMPVTGKNFEATFIGGYHSSCLGWAMTDVLSRLLVNGMTEEIRITLPMKAIFTGFVFKAGARVPVMPEDEAKSDISVDGLNLNDVTRALSDQEFLVFISDSLHWAIFNNAPMRTLDLGPVNFYVSRYGRTLGKLRAKALKEPTTTIRRSVYFHYQ